MKQRLGVIFGSRSVEHEVSIITACQLMRNVDTDKYLVVPLYIDKSGKWWTGEAAGKIESYKNQELENPSGFEPYHFTPVPNIEHGIDVAIVCCHGTLGEDGTVQGLLELAGIPYQGPGVVGSAVSMDKIVTKQLMLASGFSVANFQWFTKEDWNVNKQRVIKQLLDPETQGSMRLSFPLFIKPANLGSSVGISKAKNEKELVESIEVALAFDRRVLVEQGLSDVMEVNVSVLGFTQLEASVPEQPVSSGELLSYADKYEGGGKKTGGMASLKRRIPAPIPKSLTEKLQQAAIEVAKICDCSGVIRIDFFVNLESDQIWVGELNTIPGSMSFYLWEASGMDYKELIDRLVEIAHERKGVQEKYTRSIATKIIK
jgi:D-alanine-D-alanine ligase